MSVPIPSSSGAPSFPLGGSTPFVNPSGTAETLSVSTLSQADQTLINQVILGLVPLSPSTTELFSDALHNFADLTQQVHLADYLDALRDLKSHNGISTLGGSIQQLMLQEIFDYNVASILADEINTDSTQVNNSATTLSQALPGYNNYIQQLNSLQDIYNQSIQNVTTARNNYNSKSPQSISNYQNAVSALNTAANNYNQLNAQINNAVSGDPAYAVKNYMNLVTSYNNAIATLNADITDKNNQITTLNAENPNVQPAALLPLANAPSASAVSLPSSVQAQTMSNIPPPVNSNIPPRINAQAFSTSFTAGAPIPLGPTSIELATTHFTTLVTQIVFSILNFASLSDAIAFAAKYRISHALSFLNSFLDQSAGAKTTKDIKTQNSGQSAESGSLTAISLQGVEGQNAFNAILKDQAIVQLSIAALKNESALQPLLEAAGLGPHGQLEISNLLGQAKLFGGILAAGILQALVQSGAAVDGQLSQIAGAVGVLSAFLASLEQTAAGIALTAPPGGDLTSKFQLTGLLLAAAVLGEAAGNKALLLESLLLSLLTATSNVSPERVLQNVHNAVNNDQNSTLQHDLEANLSHVLQANNLNSDLASQLSNSFLKVTSAQDLSSQLAAVTEDPVVQQKLLDAADLTTRLTSLQIQKSNLNTSNLNSSLIFSQTINQEIQSDIQNKVAGTLSANQINNSSAIAQTIAERVGQITGSGASASTVVVQIQLAIQEALGSSSSPQLANAVFGSVQSSILNHGVTQAILATFSNLNLVKSKSDLEQQLFAIVSQINESFSKTIHEVSKRNDDVYIKKITESFRTSIATSIDFSKFVEEILSPANTFVGIMYEGIKEGFRKGWLDFAV